LKWTFFDAADVVYGVDPNAPAQGLTSDVPNVVALIVTGVDTLVRIEQLQVEGCWILASHGNGPGIRDGLAIKYLIRVINCQAADRTIRIQSEKRLSFLMPLTSRYEQSAPVLSWLRLPMIPEYRYVTVRS